MQLISSTLQLHIYSWIEEILRYLLMNSIYIKWFLTGHHLCDLLYEVRFADLTYVLEILQEKLNIFIQMENIWYVIQHHGGIQKGFIAYFCWREIVFMLQHKHAIPDSPSLYLLSCVIYKCFHIYTTIYF